MLYITFVQGTGESSTNSGLLFEPGRVSDSPGHIQQEPFGLQITQQTAYNKEVSVLSGIAKYVGFPTAPDITGVRAAELDEDMEKMGVSANFSSQLYIFT